MGGGSQQTLTLDDSDAIEKECPAVLDVAPRVNGAAQIVYGNLNWSTGIQGTSPGIFSVRDWSLASGRPLTADDVKSATKVAVLGQTVVDNLFGGIDPIDQIIRIKKIPFRVIGVLATKGQSVVGQKRAALSRGNVPILFWWNRYRNLLPLTSRSRSFTTAGSVVSGQAERLPSGLREDLIFLCHNWFGFAKISKWEKS